MNPVGIARARRKQVHDHEMDALIQNIRRLFDKAPDRIFALFVSRRNDLNNRNDLSPAMTDDDPIGVI